ncbi:MAG: acyl-CoA dehydrogenase [Rhodospirillaceae bacterium]|jgi:acyl-CoA dehydrogenase|nr:acyl-CoA dehydrogenase [Rhodospirillaceae bacterium]|tara:strand:- start:1964 stop:3130 length:1167 start_codon:yes stop_codon:yes gene_type:complete
MPFDFAEDHRMIIDLVSKFVDEKLMPLEKAVMAREAKGEPVSLLPEEEDPLLAECQEYGLWALDAPEEVGGVNLPTTVMLAIQEKLKSTITPFIFPPDSPNLHMLMAVATPDQKVKYMQPYAQGEAKSCIAISEPGAGGDPAQMKTRAVRDGDEWVINGRKIWVSNVPKADFIILMAATDPDKGAHGGITAFIVEKGTPGFIIEREIPMLGGARTYELIMDDLRLPDSQILGEVGAGFAPMQKRLTVRRLEMGAMCVGMAQRAIDMMVEHTQQRETFGQKLSDRQAIQWWIADGATKIHAARLMVMDAAEKQDRGEDVRTVASMIKVFATEMATEVIDQAMQSFGAMGMTRELPFAIMSQRLRLARIYEGPTEVHRMAIARRVLKGQL